MHLRVGGKPGPLMMGVPLPQQLWPECCLTGTVRYCQAVLRAGQEALFFRPATLFFFRPIPAPDCRRGSAPVRRPELPPPMDSAPRW